MAERVTRQFADVPTGSPVIGGLFRLVNLTDQTDLPHEMLETTDPLYPGRYYTADGDNLAPGVYRVERNQGAGYFPTGEEVSVAPHRVYAGNVSVENTSLTQVGLVMGDTVRASAFVPEGAPAGTPLLQYLQEAVNYAAISGLRKIYVGSWRGRDRWEGASQLDLSGIASVDLDLGGAEVARSGGLSPIAMNGGVIHNGRIQNTGSALPTIAVSTKDYSVVCREVAFTGAGVGATIQSGGDWARCAFRDCSGQIMWPDPAWGSGVSSGRFQHSNTACPMVGGAMYYPVDECNTPAPDVGEFFGSMLRTNGSSDPGGTEAPFLSGLAAGSALKHLFYAQKPRINEMWGRVDISDRLKFLVIAKTVMTPTAIFALNNGMGSEDTAESVLWHKDGIGITDSENNQSSAIPFRLNSGLVIDKVFRAGDTKYEKVAISALMFFSPTTIAAMTYDDVNYNKFVGWIPKRFVIDTSNLTGLLLDKDGASITVPAHVIDVKAVVTQHSDTGLVPETATFCGNAAMTGAYLQVDLGPAGIQTFDQVPPQLRRLSGQVLPVPTGSTCFIGVKLDLSFTNPARTDLPRIY